mmetsp:Transcript_14602/g.18380  ORF Transcript_14602/g.18380 Transcript_14602/m.18380 type:complete len:965 (+) Transcript_14602:343-3237(+)
MSSSTANKEELEWPMDRVRSTFINFFKEKHGHTFWASSPCVPHDDPTLLFTNAGMNQYKSIFLGTCDPSLEMSTLKRAVNSQKCIRAGGKHNDLDDVGKDVYHHTFFEMLGNWSFGDYFKKEAIEFAWSCLTEEFGLDPERLYATYFGGDQSSPCDDEAREIWLRFLPAERVLPFDAKDNFWEMGATGPCGPCTEIHYDRIGNRDASKLVNADLPDVIEIWNNVFIQYNRESDGSLRSLPAQHIDTGMGFERLTSILQNVDSNYDTDIFMPLFAKIQSITGAEGYTGRVGDADVGFKDTAYRVVADHIRTLCFAIADGAVPSNDGRGYVLRRVLRRAVRYGRQNLGAELGFFQQLVPIVVELFGVTYKELKDQEEFLTRIIAEEETSFGQTLDKGLLKFNDLAEKSEGKVFSGIDAHFLYTTMGFPVDLTELMAEERGMTVDKAGFHAKMQEEFELSKEAHKAKMMGSGGKDMTLEAEQTSYLINTSVTPTDDAPKYVWNQILEGCTVKALYLGRGLSADGIGFAESVSADDGVVGVVLDQTSFYAEAGGQVNDTGTLIAPNDTTLDVENVQSFGGFVLHTGRLSAGAKISVGDKLNCSVNYTRRQPIAANHTMTHELNFVLQDTLVNEQSSQSVDQKGSLVDDLKLRFDFSWSGAISRDQLATIESTVRDRIQKAIPVYSYVAPLKNAKEISSLRAVFGEVYPDPVRVVSIAPHSIESILANPQDATWKEYSIEFCGGTHLNNTSEAKDFCLLNEEGIAKGIRRITAVTGNLAIEATKRGDQFAKKVTEAGEKQGLHLESEVKLLNEELKSLSISYVTKNSLADVLTGYSKKVVQWKKQQVTAMTNKIVKHLLDLEPSTTGDKIITRFDFGADGKMAKSVMTSYAKKGKKAALLVTAGNQGKFMVLACCPKSMKSMDCKTWVSQSVESCGGKGGGKKDSALFTVLAQDQEELIQGVLEKARSV